MMHSSVPYPYKSEEYHYATDWAHQKLQLTFPYELPPRPTPDKIFIIYIHGGAWRDPEQSFADFAPATELLLSDPAVSSKIAGIASMDYGLSPIPSDPSENHSRNYKHPEHIQDVQLALEWLCQTHLVGAVDDGYGKPGYEYILVGHSCGATMAFQYAAGLDLGPNTFKHRQRPRITLGIAGIYDLPLLVRNHDHIPLYREFVTSAFSADEEAWRHASPVHLGEQWKTLLQDRRCAIIAHSPDDELVEQEQADTMLTALRRASSSPGGSDVRGVVLAGKHNEAWQKGYAVQQAVLAALRLVYPSLGTN